MRSKQHEMIQNAMREQELAMKEQEGGNMLDNIKQNFGL